MNVKNTEKELQKKILVWVISFFEKHRPGILSLIYVFKVLNLKDHTTQQQSSFTVIFNRLPKTKQSQGV